MQYKNAAIIVAGLAAQQTLASYGGSWNEQSGYSCPENSGSCSSSQQGGYDWSGLQSGSFSSYGSNSFKGFSCSESSNKRDLLSKREFQSKCISANLDDEPSMSSDSDSGFSISEMQVSASQDTDIQCEYGMPDGTTCTEYHSCSAGGSVLQNSQCGGAKSVTFKPGSNAPPGCSIGVHSVGFNCGSSSSPPSYSSTTATPASYSSTVPTSPASTSPSSPATSSTVPGCYGGSCSSSSSSPVTSSSVVPSYPASSSGSWSGSSVVPSTSPSSPVSSSSTVPGCYGGSCSSSSSSPVSSSSVAPSYPASSSGSWSSSVVPSTPASSSPVSSSSSAPPSYPTPSCPDLLPKCLKTWLFQTSCTDASDYSCFCGNEQFINKVYGCISAWGSASDAQAAASYLMGICAGHVPTNPAIITGCPSTISPSAPAYTPPVTGASETSPQNTAPCTTITYSSPVVIPATYTTGVSQGWTVPASSITTTLVTTVTVPQVQLTTSTITVGTTTSCSVGLQPGTPSSAPATTTPPSTTGGIICNEYQDGQPQCSSAAPSAPAYTPGSSAAPVTSAAPAPPAYSPTSAAAGTTFGTSWAATPSASYSGIVPATGSGAKVGSGIGGLILGAIAAIAAL